MDDLVERLRAQEWRLTAQRRVVAEALAGDQVHLTADEVLARARLALPEISRATVYNTLHELVDMGEVAELSVGSRAMRYDPNAVNPHHHLVCDVCGELRDVGVDPSTLPPAPTDAEGFTVDRFNIVFHGTCAACR